MSYMQVKCSECGQKTMIYPREDRIYKSGEAIGYKTCLSCGERLEAIVVVRKEEKEE